MRLIVRLPIVMIIYSFLGFLALSYHYQCTFRKRSFYGSFIFFLFILSEGIAILFLPSYNPSIFNYSFEYSLLELFLKIPQEIDLPAFELAAVFGNLVDNAIEDCKTVDGERVIVVRVLQKRGVLQMSVKNTFDGIIKIEDGKMLSRKRNYRERGAGLDRVSEIVDRYNGLLEYETVDAAFSVRLIIYLLH